MPYRPRLSNFYGTQVFFHSLEKCVSVKSDTLRTCRRRDADPPADLAADAVSTGSPWRRLVQKYRGIGHLSVFDENARLRRTASSKEKPGESVSLIKATLEESDDLRAAYLNHRSDTTLNFSTRIPYLFQCILTRLLLCRDYASKRKSQAHKIATGRDISLDHQATRPFWIGRKGRNTGCECVLCITFSNPTKSSKLGQNLKGMESILLHKMAMEEISPQNSPEKRLLSCYLRKGQRDFPGEANND